MLEHCPICKSDDRARVGAKKDGMDRRKENETKTIVGCDLAEGERYLRPETCKVEDRFAPTFYYVPNALRSLPTFRETRARQLLAEIEYFQRHFPLLLCSAAGRGKKKGEARYHFWLVWQKFRRDFSRRLFPLCRTIFSSCTMHGACDVTQRVYSVK